jgi:hypothetical protein
VEADVSESGTFAEESAKLVEAVQQWASRSRSAAESLAAQGDSQAEGHQGPECKICPICQGLALVRNAKPEVIEHLADAATALAAAFSALLPTSASAPERRTADPVEHIDVSGDDEAAAR